jgi:hypothetical protein
VKLISPGHRVAIAILDIYGQYPGRIPTRFNGHVFAGMAVAEVYIYPEIAANP